MFHVYTLEQSQMIKTTSESFKKIEIFQCNMLNSISKHTDFIGIFLSFSILLTLKHWNIFYKTIFILKSLLMTYLSLTASFEYLCYRPTAISFNFLILPVR